MDWLSVLSIQQLVSQIKNKKLPTQLNLMAVSLIKQ